MPARRIMTPGGPVAAAPATVAFGDGKTIHFWDLGAPKPSRQSTADADVQALAFSPDGRILASGADKQLALWDPLVPRIQKKWTLPSAIHSLAFAPYGQHLAVGNGNGTICILRLDP